MEVIIPTPPDGTEQDPVIPQPDPVEAPVEPSEEPETVTEPIDPEPAPAPTTPVVPPLDERYRNSTSEAMILNAKNKGLESTLNKLTSADTPTDEEILAQYPDYADLNATTQKVVKDLVTSNKRQMRIDRQLIEHEAERRWQADLRQLTGKPEYTALKSDHDFEEFVLKPQHRGVDIQTLADAYLVRTGKVQPTTEPAAPRPAPASSGLPRGSGGPRTAPVSKKLTIEQAAVLRQTDTKEYMRQLKAGNIEELV